MEPKTTIALALVAAKAQLSLPGIVQALIVAGITAAVTSAATVNRLDQRMVELLQEVKELRVEQVSMRERLVKIETIHAVAKEQNRK